MQILINGEDKKVQPNLNITELITQLNMNPLKSGIAVAVDREVIPKSKWETFILEDGSVVEIIRAVQGG